MFSLAQIEFEHPVCMYLEWAISFDRRTMCFDSIIFLVKSRWVIQPFSNFFCASTQERCVAWHNLSDIHSWNIFIRLSRFKSKRNYLFYKLKFIILLLLLFLLSFDVFFVYLSGDGWQLSYQKCTILVKWVTMGGLFCKFPKSLCGHHSTDWPCIKVKSLLVLGKVCILAYIECRT